jgi:hypothetical protein
MLVLCVGRASLTLYRTRTGYREEMGWEITGAKCEIDNIRPKSGIPK